MVSCTQLHSQTFSAPELNYDVHHKKLLVIFEALKMMATSCQRLWYPKKCGHQSLELAILFHDQDPHVLTSTMAQIHFQLQLHPIFLSQKTPNQTQCTH